MKAGTLKQYLLGVIVWPVVALLLLVLFLIYHSYRDYLYNQDALYLTKVLDASSRFAHAMQLERGATAQLLRSQGLHRDELSVMRSNTDRLLSDYVAILKSRQQTLPTSFSARQAELVSLRQQIDRLTVTPQQAEHYFANFSRELFAYLQQRTLHEENLQVQKSLLAYQSLILAKEQLAQERSLSVLLQANQTNPELAAQIQMRVAKQAAYFDVFSSVAPLAVNQQLVRLSKEPGVAKILAIRALSAAGGAALNDVDLANWFDESAFYMAHLFDVEQMLGRVVQRSLLEQNEHLRQILGFQIGGAVLVFLLSLALIIRLSAKMIHALRNIVESVEGIASAGDFSRRIEEQGVHETIRVAQAVNTLLAQCRQMVFDAINSSEQIAQTAKQLTQASGDVNRSSHKQADAAAHVASVMEEVSSSVSETSCNAQQAGVLVAASQQKMGLILSQMAETLSHFQGVTSIIHMSNDRVKRLGERSTEIGEIARIIQEIADQTNLLALNAAIEAARAGEQGHGFAVVADEVRKLSEQTTQATREITTVIAAIQEQIRETVEKMQEANEQVADSLGKVSSSEASVRSIDADAHEVANNVHSIALAIREQDAAVQQVATNIEKIAHMAEENTVVASESSDVAHALSTLSNQLRASVARYKV